MLLGVDQLSQRDSRHFIGSTNWVGKRVPYHLTANGKVFLAWGAAADERVSAEELARVGERVRVTRVDELEVGLTAECAEARQGGTRPGDELGSYAVIGDLHEIVPAIVAALRCSEAAVARAGVGQRSGRTPLSGRGGGSSQRVTSSSSREDPAPRRPRKTASTVPGPAADGTTMPSRPR